MSKKCPHCGSYNTETAVGNWIERGVINAGRGVVSAGAGVIMSIFHPSMGSAAAAKTWQNTKPSEQFKGYHCCNCGKDFSA